MGDSRPDTHRHIEVVRRYIGRFMSDLSIRANAHDRSKLEPPEVEVFDDVTERLAGLTYGSVEYRACLAEMAPALEHHYAANDHHPEHFPGGIADMALPELVEMLCDWKAASERHDDGDVRESIRKNAERFGYGPEIERLLLNTVPFLERDGAG